MARTNRDYWIACLVACTSVLFVTAGFSLLAVMVLRSPTADKGADLQKIFALWGALAVAVPLFLFAFAKGRGGSEPASGATKVLSILVTAGFTFVFTAVSWGGLFVWRGVQQSLGGTTWPPEYKRNFVDSCAAKANRPMCACFAEHLEREGNALETTALMVRLQTGDPAATAKMNELKAQCLRPGRPGGPAGRP